MGGDRPGFAAELGRLGFGAIYVVGGVVHLIFWRGTPDIYTEITPHVRFDWYRSIWTGGVLPNLDLLLPALALFEFLLAALVWNRGVFAHFGHGLGAAFQVALAPLGFWWPANVVLAAGHVVLARVDYPVTSVTRLRRICRDSR